MQIQQPQDQYFDLQEKPIQTRVTISTHGQQFQQTINLETQCILIGRKQHSKGIKCKSNYPIKLARFPSNQYLSNQHLLLTFTKCNRATSKLIVQKCTDNKVPEDIIDMIVEYWAPKYKISARDLGSTTGSFLSTIPRRLISANQYMYVEKDSNFYGFQLLYMHTPEGKNNFRSERERLGYFYSKSPRLLNYLRNCDYKNIPEQLAKMLKSYHDKNDLQLCNINEFLYEECYITIFTLKGKGYFTACDGPRMSIPQFQNLFVATVLPEGLMVESSNQIFMNLSGPKPANSTTYLPSSEISIKNNSQMILGNNMYTVWVD